MGSQSRFRARTAPDGLVILGQPVAHSLSPVFQNAALAAVGLPVHYARRDVSPDALHTVLGECRAGNVGGNVTMPHKAAVFAQADLCSSSASRTGAVNTFWWDEERLVGHNTDVDGITSTLHALCPHGIDGDVLVLGAGGAAGAALVALDDHLAPADRDADRRVLIMARTAARATALSAQVQVPATVLPTHADIDWSRVALVINTTPTGMHAGDPLPLPVEPLASHTAVFDLVYKPEGTRWVQAARARGLNAEDGLRMLVEQGASAFESWFGMDAPRHIMWQALGVPMPSPGAPRA